jgi:hypothetical protein
MIWVGSAKTHRQVYNHRPSPRGRPLGYTDGVGTSGHEPTNSRSTFGGRRAAERKLAARRAASTTTQVGRRAVRPSGWAVAHRCRQVGRSLLWPRAGRFGVVFARGRVRRVGRRHSQNPGVGKGLMYPLLYDTCKHLPKVHQVYPFAVKIKKHDQKSDPVGPC